MKVAFIWQGINGRYGHWQDGLYAAMKLIEKDHEVEYCDVDELGKLYVFQPDVVLYWEAPCTLKGKDAEKYRAVMDLPYKKALLFAGGPVERETCRGFDLYFVESRLNEEEFEALGLPWRRAFGVNEAIFKPEPYTKLYDGVMQATFAGWKRHELFAEALGDQGLVCGRLQDHDRNGFNECVKRGVKILPEQGTPVVSMLINKSHTVVNTSEFWGGGQRCTLEAMACGVPVIVMADSPKNREYVEESGGGMVVEPKAEAIRDAIALIKQDPYIFGIKGANYIKSHWTARHYADALLAGIAQII